jgi:hypothetical protein
LLAIYSRKNKGFVGTATIYRPKWSALGSFGLQRAGRGPRAMNSLSFEFRAHGGGSNGQIAAPDTRRPGRALRGLRGPGYVSAPPGTNLDEARGSCGADVQRSSSESVSGPRDDDHDVAR